MLRDCLPLPTRPGLVGGVSAQAVLAQGARAPQRPVGAPWPALNCQKSRSAIMEAAEPARRAGLPRKGS